ncbi:MAG: C39 family peptidase [Victivallales bacterium]
MSDDTFSVLNQPQENYANCGPTSLSYCLFTLFGEDIDQGDVASSLYSGPKKWYKTTYGGFDQDELRRAAGKFKVKAEFLQVYGGNKEFDKFNRRLVSHLKSGNPAMLSIYDGGHWIAILGYEERNGKSVYYVNDPDQTGDEVFDIWKRGGVKEEFDEDDKDYFAILLNRKDGKPPVFPLSRDLRRLVDDGSFDTLSGMIEDLKKIAETASEGGKADSYLADHLMTHKKTILGVIGDLIDWDSTESDLDEVSVFYDDYITVARASRIKISRNVNLVLFTAYMTSLLTTCAWCGEL